MQHPYLIAVHAGAGYHASSYESKYRTGLIAASKAASQALCAGKSSLDAVTEAIVVLEDCQVCNAGQGSNLTFGGLVECDASVMSGNGAIGLVGAVPGVTNPVLVAHKLSEESQQPLSHGRVRPIMLAGDQARCWALSRGIPAASSALEAKQWHVTQAARGRWEKYRQMVDGPSNSSAEPPQLLPTANSPGGSNRDSRSKRGAAASASKAEGKERSTFRGHPQHAKRARMVLPSGPSSTGRQAPGGGHAQREQHDDYAPSAQRDRSQTSGEPSSVRQQQSRGGGVRAGGGQTCQLKSQEGGEGSVLYDTVGCVVVDDWGRVAAGVSSGGIALKTEGRVGEAAVPGAGCWAEQREVAGGRSAVACSVSGVGEHIMRHMVARECAAAAHTARHSLRQAENKQKQQQPPPPPQQQQQQLTDAEGRQRLSKRRARGCPLPSDRTLPADNGRAGEGKHGDGGRAEDEGGEQGPEGAGLDPVSSACAAVLHRTVLQGPLPRDCGVLCVRAITTATNNLMNSSRTELDEELAAAQSGVKGELPRGDSVVCKESGTREEKGRVAGQDGERGRSWMVEVELGVACSSKSMAVGYLTHDMIEPGVTFLKGDNGSGTGSTHGASHPEFIKSSSPVDVRTLLLGLHWRLNGLS